MLGNMRVMRGRETVWRSVLACPEGLEPPTYSLEGYCSIQLSYGQIKKTDCDLRVLLSATVSMKRCIIPAQDLRPEEMSFVRGLGALALSATIALGPALVHPCR